MEKKLNRKPTAAELYQECHTNKDGQFVNSKTQDVWNDFEKRKAANLNCESENHKTEDDLFFESTAQQENCIRPTAIYRPLLVGKYIYRPLPVGKMLSVK